MKVFLPNLFLTSLLFILSCTSPETTITISDSLHDIEILDEKHVIVYGYGTGTVYETRDGGITWSQLTALDSIYFEQLQFLDKKHGWICGENGQVLLTYDGGKTWHLSPPKSSKSKDKNMLFYGMLFDSPRKGLVSGMELNTKERKIHKKLFRTSDGGKKWEDLSATIPFPLLNLVTPPGGELWGTGRGIAKENEGTWEVLFMDSTRKINQIRSVAFGDNMTMAVDFSGHVLRSIDDGANWSIRQITKNRLRQIEYLGSKTWIAVGDTNKESGNLFISQDDGTSWETSPEDYPDIHRIARWRNTVWMVGKNGFILKRTRVELID